MKSGVLKAKDVRWEERARAPGRRTTTVPSPVATCPPAEPEVRLIRHGARLEAIELTCSCGRQAVFTCVMEGDETEGGRPSVEENPENEEREPCRNGS